MTEKTAPACPRCQIGYLQPGLTTYSGIYHGTLLSVPNVPTWTCDICQYQEYDDVAMLHLEALVGDFTPPADTIRPASKPQSRESELTEKKPTPRFKP